MPSRAASLASA